MTVLDIDLDFFVSPIYQGKLSHSRLSDVEYKCASDLDVIDFLENRCLLSATSPVKGATFERHSEVFDWFKGLIGSGITIPPFDLTHVDAHSDMEGGIPHSYEYIATELLWQTLDQRQNPKRGSGGLNDSNFIIYMAACHWLQSLKFVTPSTWSDDIQFNYMKGFSASSGAIELRRIDPAIFQRSSYWRDIPYCQDIEVPFEQIKGSNFIADVRPDIVLLTRSPDFTPSSADRIFDLISRYISF